MRERNVFGKKINRVSFVFVIFLIFGAVIAARFGILSILDARLAALQTEQAELQASIDDLIAAGEASAYHEVGSIIAALPDAFDQIGISAELELVKNLAGLANATDYQTTFDADAANPFADEVAASVKAVRITVAMTVGDPADILAYLTALGGLERIYYVDALQVDYLDEGAVFVMTIYTFYNDVVV